MKLDRIERAAPRRFAERLDRPPPPGCEAAFPADFGRRFVVFGDTEEEFDWGAPLSRDRRAPRPSPPFPSPPASSASMAVVPTYVADWPVVTNPASAEALQAMAEAGACDVGAHLHPWVNPPHEEEVTPANSFAGALPEPLEAAKLRLLTERIADAHRPPRRRLSRRPLRRRPQHRPPAAGARLRLDVSVRARFDYQPRGRARFHPPPDPALLGRRELLEVPLTTCLAGPLGRAPALTRSDRLRGPLARTGLLNRIPLTPEGVPLAEAKDAIETAARRGPFPLQPLLPHADRRSRPHALCARRRGSARPSGPGGTECSTCSPATMSRRCARGEIVAAAARG